MIKLNGAGRNTLDCLAAEARRQRDVGERLRQRVGEALGIPCDGSAEAELVEDLAAEFVFVHQDAGTFLADLRAAGLLRDGPQAKGPQPSLQLVKGTD